MEGNGSDEARVKFGPRDWQTMPLAWAERVLVEWRRTRPAEFGKVLAKVATEDVDEGGR